MAGSRMMMMNPFGDENLLCTGRHSLSVRSMAKMCPTQSANTSAPFLFTVLTCLSNAVWT